MKRIYFCYSYKDSPRERTAQVKLILGDLHKRYPDVNFYYPHLGLPDWEAEFGRKYTIQCNLDEVERSNELWIGYRPLSTGMLRERRLAKRIDIPIIDRSKEIKAILEQRIL